MILRPRSPNGSANAALQAAHFADPRRSAPRMAPADTPYVRRHLDAVLAAAAPPAGARLLELGAGMGRFSLLLAARGFDVTACDLSPPLLEVLAEHDPDHRIRRVAGDAATIESQVDAGFDAVLGFFFLHHLPDPVPVLAAARRLLAPGGRAVFCEPHAWYVPLYLQILLTPGMSWRADRGVAGMRRRRLDAAFRQAGLEPLRASTYGLFPPALLRAAAGRRLERWLERLPRTLVPRAFLIAAAERPRVGV